MNILKRSDPGTFAMLTMGKYAGCAGDTYRWQAPMGQELYVGLMNQEKKRAAIASALTQASGMQCRFEAIGAVKEKKPTRATNPPRGAGNDLRQGEHDRAGGREGVRQLISGSVSEIGEYPP